MNQVVGDSHNAACKKTHELFQTHRLTCKKPTGRYICEILHHFSGRTERLITYLVFSVTVRSIRSPQVKSPINARLFAALDQRRD